MRGTLFILIVFWGLFSKTTTGQTFDTLISVGNGQQLHFTIIKGKEAPILFESGFGNGGDVWKNITKQIADATGATIITYDRLSYAERPQTYQISFENEIKALELGLQKLGYSGKNIMLVGHSLGGMYNSYYASRHPTEVKADVLIDVVNICSLTSYYKLENPDLNDPIEKYFARILDSVVNNPMPLHIPVIDIVAERHYDEKGNLDTIWLDCHKKFVAQSSSRKFLLAYAAEHYVFNDNPPLVINSIITQYANFLAPKQKAIILEKAYGLSLAMINESKKNEVKCGHSEADLNTWAYSFLNINETDKAIEIFKLNVTLNPEGWNAYDSLAEAYLKAGNKDLAIKNYKKSLELNPKNDNAINVLEQIQK